MTVVILLCERCYAPKVLAPLDPICPHCLFMAAARNRPDAAPAAGVTHPDRDDGANGSTLADIAWHERFAAEFDDDDD